MTIVLRLYVCVWNTRVYLPSCVWKFSRPGDNNVFPCGTEARVSTLLQPESRERKRGEGDFLPYFIGLKIANGVLSEKSRCNPHILNKWSESRLLSIPERAITVEVKNLCPWKIVYYGNIWVLFSLWMLHVSILPLSLPLFQQS